MSEFECQCLELDWAGEIDLTVAADAPVMLVVDAGATNSNPRPAPTHRSSSRDEMVSLPANS